MCFPGKAMTEEQIRAGVAEAVCLRFMNLHESTSRHSLLIEFENPDLLLEMEQRSLLQPTPDRIGFLPKVGTFMLLSNEHELYQRAYEAYGRTIYALWNLYRSEGSSVSHEPIEFTAYVDKLYSTPSPEGLIPLGLYLAREFNVLGQLKMSDDQLTVETFQVSDQVIRMRDSAPWWEQRVQASRAPIQRFAMPVEDLSLVDDPDEEYVDSDEATVAGFDDDSFWTLIHPIVKAAARPRFEAGHLADAVEWALKVIAEEVRRRSGLTLDGADLMHQAFSPKRPYLIFEDPIPSTQASMQQGYMEVFAGAMTGVRNPKAHGMIHLNRRRFIHFIFLASLLAEKLDEAVNALSAPSA